MTQGILVAYFSRSGNTRKIANLIHKEVGGVLLEILPEMPYPNAYNAVVEQAKKEIQSGYKPTLKTTLPHNDQFDVIFIGSPNWWSTIAPPVATFLSDNDFSGKTILPFCTHGGGGLGRIDRDIAKLCPGSTILRCLKIYGSGTGNAQAEISAWLRRIGILH